MLRSFLTKLGYWKIMTLCTAVAVIGALFLTILWLSLLEQPYQKADLLLIPVVLPVIITPLILHYIVKLVFDLNEQELAMRQVAQHDSLTALLSRRAWFEFAEQYEVIAKRQNQPFTLLMLDLDNFKKVNDDFGHLAGDAVIKALSKITQLLARDSDIIGRFGGEEFIFLLPDTNAEQAYALCERLHNQIRSSVVEFEQHKLTFTTSIGIACQTENHNHSLDHLISLADNALYTAKSRGKNCSFLHRESVSNSTPSYA